MKSFCFKCRRFQVQSLTSSVKKKQSVGDVKESLPDTLENCSKSKEAVPALMDQVLIQYKAALCVMNLTSLGGSSLVLKEARKIFDHFGIVTQLEKVGKKKTERKRWEMEMMSRGTPRACQITFQPEGQTF